MTSVPLPDATWTAVFLGLVVICLTSFATACVVTRPAGQPLARALGIVGACILGWLALSVAATQAVWALPDPRLGQTVGFSLLMLCAVGIAFSPLGSRFAGGLPYLFLIGFHTLRLPLEIMLHGWFLQGFLPIQMTYVGDNYDILTGVLAPATALLIWQKPHLRWPIWLFNVVAFGLLLRVISIVLLSSPTPLRALLGGYETRPEVLVGLYLPYAWLAWVLVFFVMILHLVLFRKLWGERARADRR